MAITAMGLGTKSAEGSWNLDPQDQFWSFLQGMAGDHTGGVIFSGFSVDVTDPASMQVQVGGKALTPDSAVYYGDGTSGNYFSEHTVLFSSDGNPTTVTITPTSSTQDETFYIVSYVMGNATVASSEQTPGTPELVKTIAVTGATGGAPSASEIEAAKESGAEVGYIVWGQVTVTSGSTAIDNTMITQANDMTTPPMRNSRGLLFDDSLRSYLTATQAAATYQPVSTQKFERVTGFYTGGIFDCSRWGNFCNVTIHGRIQGTAMGSSGSSNEHTPSWCRPLYTSPRFTLRAGTNEYGALINFNGGLEWWGTASTAIGNDLFACVSWVAASE